MDIILAISIAVGCLIIGGVIGFVLFRYIIKQKYNQIIKEAQIEAAREAYREEKQIEEWDNWAHNICRSQRNICTS